MEKTRWERLLLLAFGLAIPAFASGAPDSTATGGRAATPPVARGVQDTVTVLKPLVVPGAHKPIDDRATATTTRLDRGAVARFMPSTAGDALVTVPGVDVVKTGPWAAKVAFRGFEGERVLVMVDGVRLNTGRGHGSNASLVSVDRLDGVELTAGAGGAEHGSDAIGGVVNLVTHRSLFAEQPALSAVLSARGSEPGDEYAQTARLRFLSKRFGAEVSGGTGHLNGLVTPKGDVPNSGSHDADASARGVLKLGDATLDLEHTHHAARDVGLPALNGRYPLNARDADRAEMALPFAVPLARPIAANVRLLASDQRYRTDFDESSRDTVLSSRTHQPIAFHDTFAQDKVSTRMRGLTPELRFGDQDQVRLGGEWRRETTSGPKTTTVTTRSVSGEVTDVAVGLGDNVPHAVREVRAGSIGVRVPVRSLRIETAARYDWFRSSAESTATSWAPPLDVVDRRWSVDGGLAMRAGAFEPYARVATGFRVPNLEERYYRGPIHGALDVYGNPRLEAERNVTYEAGLRGDADGLGSMRVSAYRTYSRDFIALSYLGFFYGRPRFLYVNRDRVQIDGLEFSGRVRVRSTTSQLAVTLPRGRDLATGRRLDDIGTSRVTLDVATPVGRWLPSGILSLRARWSDGIAPANLFDVTGPVLSRHAFWTAYAELATTLAGTRAAFAVRNLFDNTYREPLSFIDEPGRTYSFALRREFQLPLPGASAEPAE